VEHPCHQCGASVEEGTVFCPQCNAPQIRVATSQPLTSGNASEVASYPPPPPRLDFYSAGKIQWSQALPAILIGGVVIAMLMMIPLGAFGFGMLAGGGLSVALYHRRTLGTRVTVGMGARLGALSGVVGFGLFMVLVAIDMLVNRDTSQFRATLMEQIQRSAARAPGPETQQMVDWLKTPAGLTFIVVVGLVFAFLFFVFLSGVGGAIGAALLRRKPRP
jgi:hypothetical protein